MADHVSFVTRKEGEIFTVGGAWHGFGNTVQQAQTRKEAEELSGTGWEVYSTPLVGANGMPIPDKKANFRLKPDGSPLYLGTVGKDFEIIQNSQAWDAMDAIVGEGNAKYTSAGALKDGRRIFIQARLDEELNLGGRDQMLKYLTLANGHDGGMAFYLYFTLTRVVCWNTLSASLADTKDGIMLRHVGGDLNAHIKEAADSLAIANEYFKAVAERMTELAQAKCDVSDVNNFLQTIYPDWVHTSKGKKTPHSRQATRDDILIAYGTAPGQKEIQGTWWGAYNAVTWYEDHGKWEGSKADAGKQIEAMAFGDGYKRKKEAFGLALEMAGVE